MYELKVRDFTTREVCRELQTLDLELGQKLVFS